VGGGGPGGWTRESWIRTGQNSSGKKSQKGRANARHKTSKRKTVVLNRET